MNNHLLPAPSDSNYQPPAATGAPAKSNYRIKVQKFLTALRRFWWIPLVTLTLFVTLVAIQFHFTPPTFVSYARMWETEKLRLPDGEVFTENPDTYFGTLNELLRSGRIKENAIQILKVSKPNIPIADQNGNEFDVHINLYQAPKSSVFTIEASSVNPGFTPAFLDALMSAYLDFTRAAHQEVSSDTLKSIETQVERFEQDLKTDQDAMAEFNRSNNFVVLQQENEIAAGYLAKLRTQLADYQLQVRLLDGLELEKEANISRTSDSTSSLFDTLHHAASATSPATETENAYRDIQVQKVERERLSKYLRPEHPKIKKLDEDIARSQKLIDFFHLQNQEQLATARKALAIQMDALNQSITNYQDKVAYATSLMAEADRLKVKLGRDDALYQRLAALVQNVDINRKIDQQTLTVLENACPASRSYAEVKGNFFKAVFGGLAGGLAIVFLISLKDDRITSLVEVCEKITDDVIGQVPEIKSLGGTAPLRLLEKNDDRHMFIESYRSLRSALLFPISQMERVQVMLVTSAVANEGKSTVATNLARVFALGGSRVLLVDADMRRGHLHDWLGFQSKPGLAELLHQPGDLDKIIQTNSFPNLSFIARGSSRMDPGDALLGAEFEQFLTTVRQRFDYIIIDTSPVFAADDATSIAPKVDGTLFVVRSHFSRSSMIKSAMEQLARRRARVLGLILNRANSSDHSYYYYKDADYYSTVPDDKPVNGQPVS